MPSRRDFLGATIAGGAMTMVGPSAAVARAPYRESRRIDLHGHHLAPDYLDAFWNVVNWDYVAERFSA